MGEKPRRRLLDQTGGTPTFVAAGCHLTGDLETPGPVIVCGSVRGDGKIGGALSMATESAWEGEIHAQRAVIAGHDHGQARRRRETRNRLLRRDPRGSGGAQHRHRQRRDRGGRDNGDERPADRTLRGEARQLDARRAKLGLELLHDPALSPARCGEILEKSAVPAVARDDDFERRRMRQLLEACDRDDRIVERGDEASPAPSSCRASREPVIE